MLNLMRKHARNWLMKVILGIIIIVFVFYFGSMGGKQRAERIAMVDGKPIVQADFQKEYQNAVEMYRQRYGQGVTDEMLKSLNLKQQVLENLINQAVITEKAKAMNIRVTNEDVKAAILANPRFQRDGVFNERIYQETLRAYKLTPEEFEKSQEKILVNIMVEDLIRDSVRVTDEEAYEIYRMQNEKINIDFVQISPKTLVAGIKTSPAELEAFLKAHESQFRVPEQVQIKFLAFMGQDYASPGKVSAEDISDYYDRHKERWTKDKKVQPLAEVRGSIAVELALANGMYAAADDAKKAHDTIYQNENFDAYAAQNKLSVRTTGLFRISNPPPEFKSIVDFAKIASRLEKNEISRAIQGEKGYYLLQVVDRKAAYVPALKEIETDVAMQYRDEEAKRLAKKEADDFLARLKGKDGNLAAGAKEKGLKVQETGLFQPGGPIPKVGNSPELAEVLSLLSEKKPYPEQTYLVDGNYVIVRFKERGSVDKAAFAAQKDSISKYLIQMKRADVVNAWIEGSKAALIKEGRIKYTRELKDL